MRSVSRAYERHQRRVGFERMHPLAAYALGAESRYIAQAGAHFDHHICTFEFARHDVDFLALVFSEIDLTGNARGDARLIAG